MESRIFTVITLSVACAKLDFISFSNPLQDIKYYYQVSQKGIDFQGLMYG
jgi:hypothetical protein